MSISDYLITLFVVCVVLFAAWRGGQVNPVGTGKIVRRMDELERQVGLQGARMDGIEKSVLLLADTAKDTSKSIDAMRMELAADRGLTERTWSAVSRLQDFFIEDSFKRRDGR